MAGAGFHQTVGGVADAGCVVSLGLVLLLVSGGFRLDSCPYFENCIVDASISL